MMALIHAELLKLRSTRTTFGLLLATLGLETLTVTVSVPKAGADAPVALSDPAILASAVGNSFGAPEVLMVLLGGMAFTQEFRYGTATSTYLAVPSRACILLAKLLALTLTSLVISVLVLALAVPFSAALISSRNGEVAFGTGFWQMTAASFLVMVAYAAIGVAFGALVRNQIIVVVCVLVWMLAVEQIVLPAFPAIGKWLPGGATYAAQQLGPSVDLDGKLLPAAVGALLLVGYAAMSVAIAARLTPRRDVL